MAECKQPLSRPPFLYPRPGSQKGQKLWRLDNSEPTQDKITYVSNTINFAELKTSGVLPSPEGVALKIMHLCEQDNVSLSELARIIQADPVLVGRIIKIANEVNPNKNRPVASVTTETLITIGINAIRQVTLTFSLIPNYQKGGCEGFDYIEFWSHSTAMASAAMVIGSHISVAQLPELFTCGLIAGIGRLCLASARPVEYSKLLQQYGSQSSEILLQAESDYFGMNRRDLTLEMMTDWGFPQLFIDSVFHHESPDRSQHTQGSRPGKLTYTLHLASLLGRICLAEEHERAELMPAIFQKAATLGLNRETTVDIANQTIKEWRSWGSLLGVKTRELPPIQLLDHDNAETAWQAKALTAHKPDQPDAMRILVIDTDQALIFMLNKLFSAAGHTVYTAQSGRTALNIALEQQPHIVITEWILPDINPATLCQKLRTNPDFDKSYFVALTSSDSEQTKSQARKAGIDAYIHKPFSPKVINDILLAAQRKQKKTGRAASPRA
jgi:two-component system cell cycle response regulator